MSRSALERRLIKLEPAPTWWRQKVDAGKELTESDIVAMSADDLLAYLGMTFPNPEAFVAEIAEQLRGPECAAQWRAWCEARRARQRAH